MLRPAAADLAQATYLHKATLSFVGRRNTSSLPNCEVFAFGCHELNRQSGATFIFGQVGLAPIPFEDGKTYGCCAIIDLDLTSMFALIRALGMNANGLSGKVSPSLVV